MSDEFFLDTDDLQRRMDGAMGALKTEFASLRTGRASASMLEPITVEAYGQRTPINQVGTVNVPEPRMVTVNVWDKSMVNAVEKAIRESGLGINPQLNGTIIMLPIPELNEERRRELTRVAAQYAESAPFRSATFAAMVWIRSKRPKWTEFPRMIKNSGKAKSKI
jgi:ribosome recycling factor